ncbi:MAG TPA: N-acetylmuramidase [Gammaproteobacteria bacterium]|nr:N-acetylmuramidase [Gammaproteobacteria bacterium]
MADFNPAFEIMIRNEGGYQLHNVSGDRGGQTYAGIARNFHPGWEGWRYIDSNDLDNPALSRSVRNFYKTAFWDAVNGDSIARQKIAESLFDFAVNAGPRTAIKLAQLVVDTVPDGIIGPKTLEKLNAEEEDSFVAKYALAKVARYAEICNRDRSQSKFLLGWINRTLRGLA